MAEFFLAAYLICTLAAVAVKMPTVSQHVLVQHTVKHIQLAFAGTILLCTTSDGYSPLLKILTLLCASFILASSKRYIHEHSRHLLEYPIVFSLATLFLMLIVDATDLLSAFFSLVGFSLNLYVLILFDAPYAAAREAGIKYYYLSTFSSGLILYGIFLLFALTGATQFEEIAHLLPEDAHLLLIAIVFLLVGFFFKLSAFPGHLWAPEVYDGSPDPVMGFFMLPVKIAVLAFLVQFLATGLQPAVTIWQPLLTIASLGSLLWGCFGALYEKKAKRFLAYASINQIGFLLMGLACGTFEGYRAALLYLFLYALMSVGFLLIFFHARRSRDGRSLRYITDFRGLPLRYGWTLAIVLFSMAGIPPLAGFYGKYYLLFHTLDRQLYILVLVGLATSLISTYYYLRVIKTVWFEQDAPALHCTLPLFPRYLLSLVEGSLWGLLLFLSPVLTSLLTIPPLRRARPSLSLLAPMTALTAAIGVIVLPNPIHNLLCLITAFLATAFVYITIKAEFLALVFIIVYIGAVAVLFLFVIMLLNVKELTVTVGRTGTFLPFIPALLKLFHSLALGFQQAPTFNWTRMDVHVFIALYDSSLFVLIAFILLTAMIGAIVLASSATDTPK